MVSRKHRFHGYGSLRFVYSKGQTVRVSQISVKYCVNTKRDTYRVAVVVSKKVNKSAIIRNRIRRRIYEVIRNNENQIKEPYDIVLTVFTDHAATVASAELNETVVSLLKQSKIFKKTV